MCCRGQFITSSLADISQRFTLDKHLIGAGGKGKVVRATNVHTGRQVAIKVINKTAEDNGKAELPGVEINMMKSLDHPNIVKLFETFEDHRRVYLVMELCEGGSLDKIKSLSEEMVASIMWQLFYAARYMHKNSVLHHDLIMTNVMLETALPLQQNCVKIVDFGSARKALDTKPDMEALGFLMRYLLSLGKMSTKSSAKDASRMVLSLTGTPVEVSKEGLDLVSRLLEKDPAERYSAGKALSHDWFKRKSFRRSRTIDMKLIPSIVDRLQAFKTCKRFNRAVLHIMADRLCGDDVRSLRNLFLHLDKNCDGLLTPKEIKKAIVGACGALPSGLKIAMKAADPDSIGVLEYSQFLAVMIDRRFSEDESMCRDAFDVFDRNGDGRISAEEIGFFLCNKAVQGAMSAKAIDKALREDLDQNGDGVVSFNEFMVTMRDDWQASGIFRQGSGKSHVDAISASATPMERSLTKRVKMLSLCHRRQWQDKKPDSKSERKAGRSSKSKSLVKPKIPIDVPDNGSMVSFCKTGVATLGDDDDVANLDDILDLCDLDDEEDSSDDEEYDDNDAFLEEDEHKDDDDDDYTGNLGRELMMDAPPLQLPSCTMVKVSEFLTPAQIRSM